MEREFWQGLYETGETRFDVGAPSPPLLDWLDAQPAVARRAIVPGCGYGHDVIELARRGAQVVGVDFAPAPVAAGRAAADKAGLAARARFLEQDFFALGPEHDAAYDLLFEQTCYCAIDPARRADYAALAARLVAPGGTLVFVVYPIDSHQGGPPFAIDPAEVAPRFAAAFDLLSLREPPRISKPTRAGKEQLGVLRRRSP